MDEAQYVATLIVEEAESSPWLLGKQIQIFTGKETIIGRVGSKNDLQIQSDFVSKTHFRIYSVIYDDEKLTQFPPFIYCQDLGSTNGTYINELFIGSERSVGSPRILNDGDLISIRPHWSFRFHQTLGNQRNFDSLQTKEIELFEGRYSISRRLLGEGGCAMVYLATDVASQRQLACKIVDLRKFGFNSSKINTEEAREAIESRTKLIREIEFLRELNHPNIATLYKAFRSEYSLYIFSELACGGDLFSFVQAQGGCMGDLDTCVIIRQVAIAVKYLHFNGIAHRDLKPDNILVMHAGIGHRVVLTDFGYATHIGSSRRMTSLVGTREYVAPEVYKSENKGYTKAVDMWSMGIVTLSLFTGDTHIRFSELRDLEQSIITTRIINALQHPWVQISAYARDFIEKLLVLDPKERIPAHEATEHNWFQRPGSPGVAAKLDELLDRANEYWWKRKSSINLIENLPDVTTIVGRGPDTYEKPQLDHRKTRKKIPDATASPYFGLDRHLQRPEAVSSSIINSKRRRLLADLIETDSQFIDTYSQVREGGLLIERVGGSPIKPNMNLRGTPRKTQIMAECLALRTLTSKLGSQVLATTKSVKEVDATDLFGTTPVHISHAKVTGNHFSCSNPLQQSSTLGSSDGIVTEAQDINIQSTGNTEHDQALEKLREFAYQHIPSQVPDVGDLSPVVFHEGEDCDDANPKLCMKSTRRNYSESVEDRNLHEEAAKALPKLATAMAYSQAIAKERQATRTK